MGSCAGGNSCGELQHAQMSTDYNMPLHPLALICFLVPYPQSFTSLRGGDQCLIQRSLLVGAVRLVKF